ncbi:44058_t:CDS:2, partial [Gigaspora margarita]
DELFDTLSELLDYIEDLEELTNESQISSDIKALNQTLLTNGRYVDRLDKKRKIHYYDNLIVALQKPSQPKRPVEDSNLLMRTPNNAKPIRNANGNTNVQITFI